MAEGEIELDKLSIPDVYRENNLEVIDEESMKIKWEIEDEPTKNKWREKEKRRKDDIESVWDNYEEETSFNTHDGSSIFHFFNSSIYEEKIDVKKFIISVYDNPNLNELSYGTDEIGYWVSLNKSNSLKYYVTVEGVQAPKGKEVPPTILKWLGKLKEDVIEEEIDLFNLEKEKHINKIKELEKERKILEKSLIIREKRLVEYKSEDRKTKELLNKIQELVKDKNLAILEKDNIIKNIERENKELLEINKEIDIRKEIQEEINTKKTLVEKIRDIFKKNGFTITSVILSIGTVITTLIFNLTSNISYVLKGVAYGVKNLGIEMAKFILLPEVIRSIASFIFKTAGSVLGFLANNNAWLLIIFTVTIVIEQIVSKNK